MRHPLSAFVFPAILLAIGIVAAILLGGDLASIAIVAGSALVAALMFQMAATDDSEPTPVIVPAPPELPLFRQPDFIRWAGQENEPLLGIDDGIVVFANQAATHLLGVHIIDADIRTALRHPVAIDWLSRSSDARSPEQVDLLDFPRAGQRWSMRISTLSHGQQLLFLSDRSAIDAVDRMRSDFVANASHELRTPLAAIIGYVETLRELAHDADAEIRERFLGIIERESRRMQQLVDDLLSISRVEADRFRRPTGSVDMAEMLQSVVSDLQSTVADRGSDLSLSIEGPIPPMIGDHAQLTQLAHNIVANALKYGRTGTPVLVALSSRNAATTLRVSDTGDGVAPEHLPRLTERFYRVDDARSRSVGGTGLGLAIVKHIAERHRGRLEITSEVGQGTVVSVSFPVVIEGPIG